MKERGGRCTKAAAYRQVSLQAEASAEIEELSSPLNLSSASPGETGESEGELSLVGLHGATDGIHCSNLPISIDDAIERIGGGIFQYRLMMAAGLAFAADGMQIVLLTFLAPILQQEWKLSNEAMASLTSAVFAGAMAGTLILGPLADSRGRRPVFLLSASIIALLSVGVALSTNYWMVVTMIFFVGVGVGGLTVPFDLLAEFLPAEGRGTKLLLINYFWTGGCLLVVVLAYFTLHGGKDHWRWFVMLCSVPCTTALLFGIFYVPESARWLVTQGRHDEAMKILREAAAINGHEISRVFPPDVKLMNEKNEVKQASIADLFAPKWREIILRLWGVWGGFAFAYYGTIMATTRVFKQSGAGQSGQGSGDEGNKESVFFDYKAIFVDNSAELIGVTIVVHAVDRMGRILSQVVSYSLAGIFVCSMCVLAQLGSLKFILIGLGFGARVFVMAGTCVTWVSTAEVLTTEVRSTGHSTSNAIARVGAFFAPFVIEGSGTPLIQVGVIMLVVHFFVVVCVAKLPETKGASMSSTSNSHSETHFRNDHAIRDANDPQPLQGVENEGGLVPSHNDTDQDRTFDEHLS